MKKLLRLGIPIIGLLLLWQCVVSLNHLADYILPGPAQVFLTFWQQKILILQQAFPTMLETVVGLCLGIVFGGVAAIIITYFKPLSSWFLPILIISQAIPTFAIAPLLVIWLGFGMASKIVTTILIIFFPITSALYDGLHKTNQQWLDVATTMNASTWRVFWHIKLPAALPALASGIRIAAVAAPIGAIVGEWVGASQGLGYLMLNANARMQIDMMFAVLFVIISISLALYFTVDILLKKLIWWEGLR